ncbi:MAG: alkyldihydroxyacetonephosphate synthase, partial [Thermoleophilaceae bacterium]|nr:alkyldihydroxyacetonephosphate synthase [Thermoleophilaceae bacterium]
MATPGQAGTAKWWGWGSEERQPPLDQLREAGAAARAHLGFEPAEVEPPPRLADVRLPPSRIEPPAALAAICSTDAHSRASHAYGKAYRDIVRAYRGQVDHPPDVVARPRDEREVAELLEWCAGAGAAAIPYGGGTSVVGGVEPRGLDAAVTIDLRGLGAVLEVDHDSLAARVQAGATGPALAEQLRAHGLTLRHYPQSWELSTLGGWIATRAGGHYATGATHIDDLVESVRAITPRGEWESRRLPGSGAGPSPDRLLIGSEGTLGVITEAWIRVQRPPGFRASASVGFESFAEGARAVRALAQSGLQPSNCRLLDEGEARVTAVGDRTLLVLGFESADHPLGPWIERALELCADLGGSVAEGPSLREPGSGGGADTWRNVFLQAPYLRDTLIAAGVLVDTFETAITWDRFDAFVAAVRTAASDAVAEICGTGRVTCRLTHAYPDGAAPYFTVLAPARRGSEVEQWDAVKAAVSETLIAAGGTITHHHAVGRDHRPWYDRQRPDLFADALRAAKRAVDPAGV